MLRAALFLAFLALPAASPIRAQAPAIRVFLGNDGQYAAGDRAPVEVQAGEDGYLLVAQVDPERRIRILFPLDPTDDNYIRGGRTWRILGRGDRDGFLADLGGDGVVFAAVSADPWQFDRYSLNGHWDLRTLNAEPVADPETELVNLANRLSPGRFDYDILPYTVIGPAMLADQGVPQDVIVDDVVTAAPSTTVIVDGCMGCWGPAISVGFGWGWYDPFWGPAWNPWFAPVAWNPWWGVPVWGGGWGGGWGGSWGGGWNGGGIPGWQYRQKDWDRQFAGRDVPYRDRWTRGAFNASHTVAGPMPGTSVGQRAGFRDRQLDQPTLIGSNAPAAGGYSTPRRGNDGSYQGTRSGASAEPANRGRPARAPVQRREAGQGTRQEPRRSEVGGRRPGLEESPTVPGERRNTVRPPTTQRPEVIRRGTSEQDRRAASERKPAGREPTLERRGSRAAEGGNRVQEGGRPRNDGPSRAPEAGRRGSGGGSPSVRSPSGSGRSGGPTPSAPRSGGQSSSRRR